MTTSPFQRAKGEPTTEELLACANRALPYDDDAEKSTLSSLLQDPNRIGECSLTLPTLAFYHEANRTVYEKLVEFHREGLPIDPVMVTNRLRDQGQLDKVGGPAAICELFTFIPSPAHYIHYREIVLEKHALRRHIDAHVRSLHSLFESVGGQIPLSQVIEESKDRVEAAGSAAGRLLPRRHVKDIVPTVFDQIEARRSNPGKLAGISTGLPTLDKKTNGAQPGRVWVFAGLPGDGKSTIMQQCAETAAYAGHRVDWYGLEMPDEEQVFRLLSSCGGVDNENLYTGILSRAEQQALVEATRKLKESPIHMVDTDGATATDIIADIAKSDAEIVVLDYLQLMAEEARKGGTVEEMIASVSRRLKAVARSTKKVIYTASQLNDGGKLRGSRAIGQDSDGVFLINKHPLDGGTDGEFDDTKRLFWCDKNRGGKRHWELPLHFLGHVFQFKEIHEDPAI